MQHPASFLDYTDVLPSTTNRGLIDTRTHQLSPGSESTFYKKTLVPGRYLDPVSSRFDELSDDLYIQNPVESYLKGKGDFWYTGQKKGNVEVNEPIPQPLNKAIAYAHCNQRGGWKEFKFEAPVSRKVNSSYTNVPAQY